MTHIDRCWHRIHQVLNHHKNLPNNELLHFLDYHHLLLCWQNIIYDRSTYFFNLHWIKWYIHYYLLSFNFSISNNYISRFNFIICMFFKNQKAQKGTYFISYLNLLQFCFWCIEKHFWNMCLDSMFHVVLKFLQKSLWSIKEVFWICFNHVGEVMHRHIIPKGIYYLWN